MKRRIQKMPIKEVLFTIVAGLFFMGCACAILVGLAEYEYKPGFHREPVLHYAPATGQIQEKPPAPPSER